MIYDGRVPTVVIAHHLERGHLSGAQINAGKESVSNREPEMVQKLEAKEEKKDSNTRLHKFAPTKISKKATVTKR